MSIAGKSFRWWIKAENLGNRVHFKVEHSPYVNSRWLPML